MKIFVSLLIFGVLVEDIHGIIESLRENGIVLGGGFGIIDYEEDGRSKRAMGGSLGLILGNCDGSDSSVEEGPEPPIVEILRTILGDYGIKITTGYRDLSQHFGGGIGAVDTEDISEDAFDDFSRESEFIVGKGEGEARAEYFAAGNAYAKGIKRGVGAGIAEGKGLVIENGHIRGSGVGLGSAFGDATELDKYEILKELAEFIRKIYED